MAKKKTTKKAGKKKPGLVTVQKGEAKLAVAPEAVAEHQRLGWTVAEADDDSADDSE